ncbi:MAG TPA: ABC transporter ATP-binding protein [Anaerolineae bacterium]|nr:ABC transporter ATP-binding protein [Anaerolineae bacterium]HQH39673.1 ABC transporter ATP-binding protein [Anaerolineae bacterium]
MNAGSGEYLIEAHNLVRQFGSRRERVTAVDDISFGIREGEVVCLVGESGCGKTTTGKMIAGLLKPTSGQVFYMGKSVWNAKGDKGEDFKTYRLGVQIIHQDPYASLNPSHTIYKIISAPLLHHKLAANTQEALDRVIELLTIVGLSPVEDFLYKYPHQLSGGQRQRVSVARALTVNPRFIVADEAVSMVDVSIRVGLLNMMANLKRDLGVTYLFITHDLAVAKFFAWEGRIAVMYVGSIVEFASTPQLINAPLHPYSKALLAAVPEADPELTRHKQRVELRSQDIPSLLALPGGCRFHPRCPYFEPGLCDVKRPALLPAGENRYVACHIAAREVGTQA